MPTSIKEKWEASSIIFVFVLLAGAFVAGIKADDWLRSIKDEKKPDSAKSSGGTTPAVQEPAAKSSIDMHSKNRMPSDSSTCAELKEQVTRLTTENQKLRMDYVELKGRGGPELKGNRGASSQGDGQRKEANFDARLDFDYFCRNRLGLRFVRISENSFECGGSGGESVSVRIGDACFWSFGSSRYSIEPVPPVVFCDSSALSEPPCNIEQRVCGADNRYCCPKQDEIGLH